MEENKSKGKGISIAIILLVIFLGFGLVIGLTQTHGANNLGNKDSEISKYYFDDKGTLLSYNGPNNKIRIPETYSLSKNPESVEMSAGSIYTLIDKARVMGIKNFNIEDQTGNYTDEFGNTFYQEKFIMKYKIRKTIEGNDFTVTNIGPNVFANRSNITEVVLPNTIQSIGSLAFTGCGRLQKINLPDSIERIENSAFFNCPRLVIDKLPKNLSYIGSQAFQECDKITNLEFPKELDCIGNMAFEDCDGITSLSFPSNIKRILSNAFSYCRNLETITFSEGLEFIGDSAFGGCDNLKEVVLPSTLLRIENQAFSNCNSLKVVVINSNRIPDVYFNSFSDSVETIYVKDNLYDKFINSTNWNYYSSKIHKLSEKVEGEKEICQQEV